MVLKRHEVATDTIVAWNASNSIMAEQRQTTANMNVENETPQLFFLSPRYHI